LLEVTTGSKTKYVQLIIAAQSLGPPLTSNASCNKMPNSTISESTLDAALADALVNNASFAAWFFSKTRFALQEAQCVLVRSDNPWGRVKYRLLGLDAEPLDELTRDCETDVLAVFEASGGRRLALHIENKLAGGSFTYLQPELYRERLTQWRSRPKLGMYVEATSVLVAPQVFYDGNLAAAQIFEAFVSHESIAPHLPIFRKSCGICP
jgi:hypothetical protein